jgi:predicted esterase
MTKTISALSIFTLFGCAAAKPQPQEPAQASSTAVQPAQAELAAKPAVAAPPPAAEPAPEPAPLPEGLHHHAMLQEKVGFYGVLTPPGYDDEANKKKRYPLVVILHGGGSNELGQGELAEDIGRDGVIYVLPRAPHPDYEVFAEGERAGWTAWPEYPEEWGEPDSDTFPKQELKGLDSSKLYTEWIADCIKDARRRYRVSWDKAVLVGHSQGATFAHLFATRYPWMVKTYVAYAGHYDDTLDKKVGSVHLTALNANKISPLLIHYEGDPVVKSENTRRLDEMMNARKLEHEALLLPGNLHKLTDDVKQRIRAFTREQCCGETPETQPKNEAAPAVSSQAAPGGGGAPAAKPGAAASASPAPVEPSAAAAQPQSPAPAAKAGPATDQRKASAKQSASAASPAPAKDEAVKVTPPKAPPAPVPAPASKSKAAAPPR